MRCVDCPNITCNSRTAVGGCAFRIYDREEVDFDWQSFRREAAKDILCAMIAAPGPSLVVNDAIDKSVKAADLLISRLKEEQQ